MKEHKLVKIKVSDIKLDPDNPNRLTEEQMDSLRHSMKRFGYLEPVIVDQDNLVADGEHRLQIFREFGYETIPCYKVKFENDNERLLLRQAKNKIKGEHDPSLDFKELDKLREYNEDALQSLLKVSNQDIENLRALANKDQKPKIKFDDEFQEQIRRANAEVESGENRDDEFHKLPNRIVVYFTDEEYDQLIPKLEVVMSNMKVDNYSDMLLKLVEMWNVKI